MVLIIFSSVKVLVLTVSGKPVLKNLIMEILLNTHNFAVLRIFNLLKPLVLTLLGGPDLMNLTLEIFLDTHNLLYVEYLARYRYLYLLFWEDRF